MRSDRLDAMTRNLSRYIGLVFIGVVIVPAVVLGLLAIRSIGREQVYIETELARTLSAEVDHVSTLVAAEITGIQNELAATAGYLTGDGPVDSIEAWRTRSHLIETPFLLSTDYQILWPAAVQQSRGVESEFIEKQLAFLEDEARVPVYENVAVAYKEDILGETADTAAAGPAGQPDRLIASVETQAEARTGEAGRPAMEQLAATEPNQQPTGAKQAEEPSTEALHVRGGRAGETRFAIPQDLDLSDKGRAEDESPGEQSKRQAATSLFLQSEPVREKTYRKAEEAGQEVLYRNVEPTAGREADKADRKQASAAIKEEVTKQAATRRPEAEAPPAAPRARAASDRILSSEVSGRSGQDAEKLKSIFVSQPLRFSEIVARGQNGMVPLAVDGQMRLLYWQKTPGGRVLGCLVDGRQMRERIVGALPAIYSPSRILTVLNEKGLPLIVPQGQEGRDWRRPFVAQEISEALPGWEVAAYLADPGAVSSRARTTSILMWLLIFIMFVSIVAGGTLVVRSASTELKLAQQKTTFVANVSHELKTPLTSIRMFAEMLRDGRQSSEARRRQYFDIMTAETERLTRLIDNVLDFARIEQGKKRYTMRPCNLVSLTAGIMESQRARLESNGFEVQLLVEAECLMVHADEEAIKQALVNLLSNAEKYSAETRDIEVSVGREDGKAVVRVSDRGVGIRPGEAEKIFGEFYRVDDALTSRVKGTGLGLTIARRIARDHGGDIAYSAREGGGSTFEIVLPLIEEDA
jgi:signal transduction histidine kinase